MNIKIYIDFDGTLFNTTELYSNFINIFKKYNINKLDIDKIYSQEKSLDNAAYKIIEKYNLNPSIYKELDKIYSHNLVYKDVIPFLEQYYKKYYLILLTLGNINFQEKKIKIANINKYFKDIIITEKDKSKLNIDYENGIFIDNNPLELKKFYNSNAKYLIRIKRKYDKYSKLTLDINNIPEFTSFDELTKINYIEKIGENYYE